MNGSIRIEMLGGLRVLVGDRCVTRFRTRKAGVLLAYMAFHRDRWNPRELLADMLGRETEPEIGLQRLSLSLSSLRRQLEPPGVRAGSVIQADRYNVRLEPITVSTDVSEFFQSLADAK